MSFSCFAQLFPFPAKTCYQQSNFLFSLSNSDCRTFQFFYKHLKLSYISWKDCYQQSNFLYSLSNSDCVFMFPGKTFQQSICLLFLSNFDYVLEYFISVISGIWICCFSVSWGYIQRNYVSYLFVLVCHGTNIQLYLTFLSLCNFDCF